MSVTDYCYGDSVALLPEYAVVNVNRAEVGGAKMPNAWGLFDMHGNVQEWCCVNDDSIGNSRVLRGGSFFNYPQELRSALRNNNFSPKNRNLRNGFRISRTP